jgi:hypothetical protein
MSENKEKKVGRFDRTPAEVRSILVKSLREKVEEFKKSVQETDYTPNQALFIVQEAVKEQISDFVTNLKNLEYLEKGELAKVAPPGREEQVKELKGKVDNPYAVAWHSYNQRKGKKSRKHKKSENLQKPNVLNSETEKAEDCSHEAMSKTGAPPIPPMPYAKQEMQKGMFGLPGSPDSSSQMAHKLNKNVFNIMKMCKTNDVIDTTFKKEAEGKDKWKSGTHPEYKGVDVDDNKGRREETELLNDRGPGSVLPVDKMPEVADTSKDTGSGGLAGTGKQTEVVKVEPYTGLPSSTESQKRKTIFDSVRHLKPSPETPPTNPTAPARPSNIPQMQKAGPRLGGKDPMSRVMTSDAGRAYKPLSMETLQNKNPQMPSQQQSVKMPSMDDHAQRQQSLQSFTPKGKFDKAEMLKETESIGAMLNGKEKVK